MPHGTLSDVRKLLRVLARDNVRRNAFLHLRDHRRNMPRVAFYVLFAFLVTLRLYSVFAMVAAWQGWYLDPAMWAGDGPALSEHTTPFHDYPNPFGWSLGFHGFLIAHNVTGWLLFFTCLIPLFARKGGRVHIAVGRMFAVVWIIHLIDGLANSGHILAARGFEPTRYYDVTGQGFSLYLYIQFAFISAVVIDFLAHGLAALQYKNHPPPWPMRALMLFLPSTSLAFGIGIAGWGVMRLLSSDPPETGATMTFAAIYVVQVPAYAYLLWRNIAYWKRPTPRAWLHGWLTEHQRNMMFCVQVTLYTGLANITSRHAPWLTPILFASIDVGFIVWILVEERALRRHVVRSRLGLAVVSALGRRLGAGPRPAETELTEADARWITSFFDLDGSGEIEMDELRSLLAHQGVELSADELRRLKETLDPEDRGHADRGELARFLARWFVVEPDDEDELVLAFRALDTDGDGEITVDELRRALADGDDGLTPEELERLMTVSDLDGSGAIDWHEFAAAMRPSRLSTMAPPA